MSRLTDYWIGQHEADLGLEPHQRAGYAERMFEAADMRRKEQREEALLDSYELCDRQSQHTNPADDPLTSGGF